VTFGSEHYIPVLKIKRGEKKALTAIEPSICQRITPLLEIVQRTDKSLDDHLKTAFKELANSTSRYARCFLDAREIAPDGTTGAQEVFARASAAGIAFTPVTGFSRSADVAAALGHRTRGLALRLTREEFEAGQLAPGLADFMNQHGLVPEETDLIVDLGPVDDMVVDGVIAFTDAFLSEVPDQTRWRTLTVLHVPSRKAWVGSGNSPTIWSSGLNGSLGETTFMVAARVFPACRRSATA